MNLDRGQWKRDAREAMRGRKPSVYLVALAAYAIFTVLGLLTFRLLFPGVSMEDLLPPFTVEKAERVWTAYVSGSGFAGELLSIAVNVMDMMITVGFTAFCLNVSRRLDAGFGVLFDGFGNFFRFLGMNMLISLIVSAWSMLFFIPGVVASYRYSLANYILLDDPDKGPLQCMRESRELTQGRKGQLFLLDLSFLGWYLLSAIPLVAPYALAYAYTARANAYRSISGRFDPPVHVDVSI